jgi:hypothetical protein
VDAGRYYRAVEDGHPPLPSPWISPHPGLGTEIPALDLCLHLPPGIRESFGGQAAAPLGTADPGRAAFGLQVAALPEIVVRSVASILPS